MSYRRAILIGIGSYDHLRPAEFADKDAEVLGKALTDSCDYSDVRILTNSNASRFTIEEAFQTMCSNSKFDDTFLFFFAGHGLARGSVRKQYLLFPNATEQQISSSEELPNDIAINVTEIAGRIRDIRARYKIILTDACRDNPVLPSPENKSHDAVRESQGINDRDNPMQAEYVLAFRDAARQLPGTPSQQSTAGIVHACEHGFRAYPWREKRQGVFCYSLVQALRRASILRTEFGLHWILNDVGESMAIWNSQHSHRENLNQNFEAWSEGHILLGKSPERIASDVKQSKRVVREVLGRIRDKHYGHLKDLCDLLPQKKMDASFGITIAKSPRGLGIPVSYLDTADTVWLEVKANSGIHLYAFEYGPDNCVYQHFPLAHAKRNWVDGGQNAWLPSEELGIPTRREGKSFFLAIGSEKPIKFRIPAGVGGDDYSIRWEIQAFRTEMETLIGSLDKSFENWGWALAAAEVARAIV